MGRSEMLLSSDRCVNELIEKFREAGLSKKYLDVGERSRRECNRAVQLFSNYIIENKHQFIEGEEDYRRMIRTYLNILAYVEGEKTELPGLLESFEWLDDKDKLNILKWSSPGRYQGIYRTGSSFPSTDAYRWGFLNLIEAFASNRTYDELMNRLERFADKMRRGGPATVSGILSALREDEFMVYNMRSALPLTNTDCAYLTSINRWEYREFNTIYRSIRDYAQTSHPAINLKFT
jgi:hypothetical protein